MKKFLSISFFFMSILLIATPQKSQAQDFQFTFDPINIEIVQLTGQFYITGMIHQTNTQVGPLTSTNFGFFTSLYIREVGQTNPIYNALTGPYLYTDSIGMDQYLASGELLVGIEYEYCVGLAITNENHTQIIGTWESDTMTYTITDITTSIAHQKKINFSIYPNPTEGPLTVERPGSNEIENLIIYDMTGKNVADEKLTKEKQIISVASLPNGIYFAQIGDKTKRFQVLRK